MTESEEREELTQTVPCPLCGRKFLSERLDKHTSICSKTKQSQKKRKVFDSSKQRSDLEQLNGFPVVPPLKPTQVDSKANNKTSNWRQKHQEFLRTVRQARGEIVEQVPDGDKPRVPVGYIECPSCGRSFSDKAADRHISWCREQKARIPRSANNNKAMELMKARTKYKPSKKVSPKSETPPTGPQTPPKQQIVTKSVRPSPPNSIKLRKTPPNSVIKKKSPSPAKSNQKSNQNRINSLSRPKNSSPDSLESQSKHIEPIMKFKEKFPNHATRDESKYIKNDQLKQIMKKSQTYNSGPRTVPGVRTGGMSPTKNDNAIHQNGYYSETEDEELAKLKSRIEEMYLNGSTKFKPSSITGSPVINGNKKFNSETNGSDSTTRGSTSGSSDSSITGISRDGSSDGTRSHGSSSSGLPKFCHQCGTKYPITIAKYCYECGSRRLGTVGPFVSN